LNGKAADLRKYCRGLDITLPDQGHWSLIKSAKRSRRCWPYLTIWSYQQGDWNQAGLNVVVLISPETKS